METRFENKFRRGTEAMKEVYFKYFFSGWHMTLVYIALSLYLISWILASIAGSEGIKQIALPTVMMIAMLLLLFFRYRQSVKMAIERDKELSGEDGLEVALTVTDEGITHSALANSNTIGFDIVKGVLLTKSYIAVITKARFLYILKKDSFTIGDADGFVAFLREKGIKIKGQKK
jgi:hypothetical protein